MIANQPNQLLTLCDSYAAHHGISRWRVAALARRTEKGAPGDGRFFERLSRGADCSTETYRKTVQWFSDHWPDDLAWPADIPRPHPRKAEQVA